MTKTEAGSVFMIQTKPANEAPRSPAMAGRGIRAEAAVALPSYGAPSCAVA